MAFRGGSDTCKCVADILPVANMLRVADILRVCGSYLHKRPLGFDVPEQLPPADKLHQQIQLCVCVCVGGGDKCIYNYI